MGRERCLRPCTVGVFYNVRISESYAYNSGFQAGPSCVHPVYMSVAGLGLVL